MRDLPCGTVTFLFTDVEGSTRLLRELGPATYARALAEHRRTLREAFSRRGGVEVDTQGDAFFYAFARATDALAAAEAGQQALASTPIRVRIGVHTGEALLSEGGYVGMDVHKGARIAAAGHGGQVVVSEAARLASGRHLAVESNPLVEQLLESYRPLARTIEHRTYRDLPLGKSRGARAPSYLRQVLVSTLHRDLGGLLIASGPRRGRNDFNNVRVGGESLRQAESDAIILPARKRREAAATATVAVSPDEPVALVYTCSDLYMTPIGRAVFGGELARRLLGASDVTSYLRYRTDNRCSGS